MAQVKVEQTTADTATVTNAEPKGSTQILEVNMYEVNKASGKPELTNVRELKVGESKTFELHSHKYMDLTVKGGTAKKDLKA